MITILQIKVARGLLGWSQKDLAAASSISLRAVAKIELEQVIYGNKTVFMLLAQLPIRSVLIENALLTEALRNQFEYSWKIGKKPAAFS